MKLNPQVMSLAESLLKKYPDREAQEHLLDELEAVGQIAQTQALLTALKQARRKHKLGEEVLVTSAVPLSDKQRDRLRSTLEKKWSMPVRLKLGVDPALLGGIRIQSEEHIWDHSIQGNLKRLARHLN